ncbi:hypothetical protein [Haloferax larsenii]|uniref:Methyltransferase domain-containing protein n=1 Tax=Haloferax larsenii TaxID=302484 RepID=A0A1H7VAT8_HALLR|nr:hypothetical protein [Haloferax larsenii]SEM06316.1 hypothetical protein SAMN04488691_1198 [Haloferax larsenii]
MFHILGDRERDRFIAELGAVVPSGGLYCVLGDVRYDDRETYGLSPDELRWRFEAVGGWDVVFSFRTVFKRRWSSNPAYLVGVKRR